MGPKRKDDSWIILLLLMQLIIITTINLVSCSDELNFFESEKDSFPCNYFETINITDGVKNSDNSITFEGVTYPVQHYATYGYAYKSRHEKIKVPKHIRGCVCIFKNCIRLCCEKYMYLHEYNITDRCQYDEEFTNFEMEVYSKDGEVTTYNMFNEAPIAVVHGQPCSGYFLKPEDINFPDDSWIMLEDGRLYQNHTDAMKYHERNDYCIAYVYHNSTMDNMLRAFICDELSHTKISAGYQVDTVKLQLKRLGAKITGSKQVLEKRLKLWREGNLSRKLYTVPNIPITNISTLFPEHGFMALTVLNASTITLTFSDILFWFQNKKADSSLKRGRTMGLNGFIVSILVHIQSSSNKQFFKATCKAEMKKGTTYNLKIEIEKTGKITRANCNCVAGGGFCAACKHIAAALIVIEHFGQTGMIISVPFLLATFLVYAWIKELRATLHGKSLMCYIAGLTIGYTFLTFVQLNGSKEIESVLCNTMAFAIHGSLLAAFFWLNVISFDIWWTIGKAGDYHHKRFLYYSLYAFGAPLAILIISVIIDRIEAIPEEYRPGFAMKTCWLRQHKLTEFIYWYLIILIIITLNTVFFGLTANNIRIVQEQSAKTLSRGDSRKHAKMQSEKDKFGLYLRLFIIMGVTWSMEVLSWWFNTNSWIFYVTDACNLLQGPLIFLLFVWKPRVRALIRKRYRVCRGLETETNAMSRTSTSHISMERSTMLVKHDDNGKV